MQRRADGQFYSGSLDADGSVDEICNEKLHKCTHVMDSNAGTFATKAL